MPELNRLTQPDWKNLPLGQGKSGTGIDPMTAITLLVTLGPSLLKMLGGGSDEPTARDLRMQNEKQFRTEGERRAGIVRKIGQPESAGQNILSQMAMAGKPRTTTTTTLETLPEEGLDIGSLLMMLMMMGGKKNPAALADTAAKAEPGAGAGANASQGEDLWSGSYSIPGFTPPGSGRYVPLPGAGGVPGVGGPEGPSYPGAPTAGGGQGIDLSKLGDLLSLMLGLR